MQVATDMICTVTKGRYICKSIPTMTFTAMGVLVAQEGAEVVAVHLKSELMSDTHSWILVCTAGQAFNASLFIPQSL